MDKLIINLLVDNNTHYQTDIDFVQHCIDIYDEAIRAMGTETYEFTSETVNPSDVSYNYPQLQEDCHAYSAAYN